MLTLEGSRPKTRKACPAAWGRAAACQLGGDAVGLSPAQSEWFGKLIDRAGLSLETEGAK